MHTNRKSKLLFNGLEFASYRHIAQHTHIPYSLFKKELKSKDYTTLERLVGLLNPMYFIEGQCNYLGETHESYHHFCVAKGLSSHDLSKVIALSSHYNLKTPIEDGALAILLAKQQMEQPFISQLWGNLPSLYKLAEVYNFNTGYMIYLLTQQVDVLTIFNLCRDLKFYKTQYNGTIYNTLSDLASAVCKPLYQVFEGVYHGEYAPVFEVTPSTPLSLISSYLDIGKDMAILEKSLT